MKTLTISSNRGPLTIQWSNIESLAKYAMAQAGGYGQINKGLPLLELHDKYFQNWHQFCWRQREKLSVYDNLPENSRVLDIGCGIAILDLLLYSYTPKSTFFLLDKEDMWNKDTRPYNVSYTIDHPFYHSWEPVLDAISTSNFDRSRFNFLNPEDNFPNDLDLVISSFSWCWHYPKEVYWDKVLASLKTGGKLYLDVRLLPDRNIIEEISDSLKSKPEFIEIKKIPNQIDIYNNGDTNISGHQCVWIKNV